MTFFIDAGLANIAWPTCRVPRKPHYFGHDYSLDDMVWLFDHCGCYGISGNLNVLGWLLEHRPTNQHECRSLAAR